MGDYIDDGDYVDEYVDNYPSGDAGDEHHTDSDKATCYRMRHNETYWNGYKNELASIGLDIDTFKAIMDRYRKKTGTARIIMPSCDHDVFAYVAKIARMASEGLCHPDGRPIPDHSHKPRRPPVDPLPENWQSLIK